MKFIDRYKFDPRACLQNSFDRAGVLFPSGVVTRSSRSYGYAPYSIPCRRKKLLPARPKTILKTRPRFFKAHDLRTAKPQLEILGASLLLDGKPFDVSSVDVPATSDETDPIIHWSGQPPHHVPDNSSGDDNGARGADAGVGDASDPTSYMK